MLCRGVVYCAVLCCTVRQVVSLTAGICVMTWLLCYFTIRWSASLTPVLHVSRGQLAAIASLGATLMMARSPASAVRYRQQEAPGSSMTYTNTSNSTTGSSNSSSMLSNSRNQQQ